MVSKPKTNAAAKTTMAATVTPKAISALRVPLVPAAVPRELSAGGATTWSLSAWVTSALTWE
jgi:hypothetical protein